MCTVTFVPVNKSEFIITHNRDEKLSRKPSLVPEFKNQQGIKLLYPIDADANGTWFCTDENGRIACILNGAFEKHISNPPYRKSRGLIVLDVFKENSFEKWCTETDLLEIEPFTLILFDKNSLLEFRWDGDKKHLKKLSTEKPHIWSSSTLYSIEAKNKRENWFSDWLTNYESTPKSLYNFHNYGGNDTKEINLKMEILGSHQTVSITQVHLNEFERIMNHINFVSGETANLVF